MWLSVLQLIGNSGKCEKSWSLLLVLLAELEWGAAITSLHEYNQSLVITGLSDDIDLFAHAEWSLKQWQNQLLGQPKEPWTAPH